MKARIILFAFLISALFISAANAQLEKFEAAYLVNFTRFIEWPAENSSGNFIIGVLSNDPIVKELQGLAPTKTVFGRKIEVKVFNNPESITSAHILFVPSGQSGKIESVASNINSRGTLLVSYASNGTAKGSGINFILEDNKLQFEIRKSNITKYNLKVSSGLETLAKKVY